jgi:hypothetical protein
MGKLTRYERFTKVSSDSKEPYAERIHVRRSELREMAATAPVGAVVGGMSSQGPGVVYSVPVSGGGNGRGGGRGASIQVPVGDQASAGPGLTTIESIRVKPRRNMATRHWTVIKTDGRIVTVIKDELNQQPLKAKSESDFDL